MCRPVSRQCDEAVELKTSVFILLVRLSQQETKMRNLLIAACCAALVGSVSIASAQTSGPTAQHSMKTNSPMDANAKMKKKTAKKSTKSDDSTKSDAPKDDTSKK
jgi:hypothetical protein